MICLNCPHKCDIVPGGSGRCSARGEKDGAIVCKNYGAISSLALDPIEKKPLSMFYPGSKILSAGSYGCNMSCPWCQNDSISRGYVKCDHLTCEELVALALETKERGNIGIAFTYNEPSVGFEFVLDCVRLAKNRGLINVAVSNGMLARERFDELLQYIDAYNIDLKTGDASKYASIGGDAEVIRENIKSAVSSGRHVELTDLIVPGFNDDEEDFREVVGFVAKTDPSIPLHITRFFPAGNMKNADPTPVSLMYSFYDIAKESLDNVFLGNM